MSAKLKLEDNMKYANLIKVSRLLLCMRIYDMKPFLNVSSLAQK